MRFGARGKKHGLRREQIIYPHIVVSYALNREPLLEALAHGPTAERTGFMDRVDRFVDILDHKATGRSLKFLRAKTAFAKGQLGCWRRYGERTSLSQS